MEHFSKKIIDWYQKNKRDLPWRNTKDAYLIWLSEIILQQTRVDQGMAYYNRFAAAFPTVNDLANSDTEKVMKLWQGLGYYSRARNLHSTAITIAENYKGKFPNDYNQILSLKGIGEYTAAAIASFAFDKPHAVVDGNVYRVLARVFGIETPIDSTLGKKEFNALANELLDKKNPALHNQSIMEFGAIQCKPVSPACDSCVLNSMCFAYSKKVVSELPIKAKKTKVRNRYFNYIVMHDKQSVLIKKRTEKDVWINLYDFPLIETSIELTEEQFLKSNDWKQFSESFPKYTIHSVSSNYKHVLSHQNIYARFWNLSCLKLPEKKSVAGYIVVQKSNLQEYPVSRLIEKYLQQNTI
ncbi:MAG: A/G-specific adenine glycosylase [Bacteroidia bacterium]